MPAMEEKREPNDTGLSVSEAADLLGVSAATLRNWIRAGLVAASRHKRRFALSREEVETALRHIGAGRLENRKRSRANKTAGDSRHAPREHLPLSSDAKLIATIRDTADLARLSHAEALFATSLNLSLRRGLLDRADALRLIAGKGFATHNPRFTEELAGFRALSSPAGNQAMAVLLDIPLPEAGDCLGLVHQSFAFSGARSAGGMFYTPDRVVDRIAADLAEKAKTGSGVLDPCCGSGQFLLAFARNGVGAAALAGFDIDPLAVHIARVNFFLAFPDLQSPPNIVCRDALLPTLAEEFGTADKYSVVATNPPWGARPDRETKKRLERKYPEITSRECFSYFILRAFDYLRRDGSAAFILPESVLNVRRHMDVRSLLLERARIDKVVSLDRVFGGVFTPAVRLDFSPAGPGERTAEQERWLAGPDRVFSIHSDGVDNRIVDKMFAQPHHTLAGRAEWALGIVTGDNNTFLSDRPEAGLEPVYRGRDVFPFRFAQPEKFIRFDPPALQQSAPERFYRAPEKLVYRFISRRLVFAHDDRGRLTLNSANLVIPGIDGYPMPAIAALFNSRLYGFLHEKLFFSLKVLRANLERLPIPQWSPGDLGRLSAFALALAGPDAPDPSDLDDFIMDGFGLNADEKKRVVG